MSNLLEQTQAEINIREAFDKLKPEYLQAWVTLDHLPYLHCTDDPNANAYETPVIGRFDYTDSLKFIQSVQPKKMARILKTIDDLRIDNARLQRACDFYKNKGGNYCL